VASTPNLCAVVHTNGLPVRLALNTSEALYNRLVLALLAGPELEARLLVNLWIVDMTLGGSERSTARTAEYSHRNEPRKRRARNPSRCSSARLSNTGVGQLPTTNASHSPCKKADIEFDTWMVAAMS
jgi:hypothetical protein